LLRPASTFVFRELRCGDLPIFLQNLVNKSLAWKIFWNKHLAGTLHFSPGEEWVSLKWKRSKRANFASRLFLIKAARRFAADRPDPSLRNTGLLRMTGKLFYVGAGDEPHAVQIGNFSAHSFHYALSIFSVKVIRHKGGCGKKQRRKSPLKPQRTRLGWATRHSDKASAIQGPGHPPGSHL
jgi:hypothetical protein